jgi:hypothetical protein
LVRGIVDAESDGFARRSPDGLKWHNLGGYLMRL